MNRLHAAVIGGVSLLSVLLATVPPAAAQGTAGRDYPVRPLHVVVAFSPGTAADTIARAVGSEAASQLGVPALIEHREGAGGHIGHTAAAKAPADGYTLLTGTTWMALTPHGSSPPAYDAVKDFMPIARVGQAPMLVVAGASTVNRSWAVGAAPMTFSVGGKQYVAVVVGRSGSIPAFIGDLGKTLLTTPEGGALFMFTL